MIKYHAYLYGSTASLVRVDVRAESAEYVTPMYGRRQKKRTQTDYYAYSWAEAHAWLRERVADNARRSREQATRDALLLEYVDAMRDGEDVPSVGVE